MIQILSLIIKFKEIACKYMYVIIGWFMATLFLLQVVDTAAVAEVVSVAAEVGVTTTIQPANRWMPFYDESKYNIYM